MAVAPKLDVPDAVTSGGDVCGRVELEHLRKVPLFNDLSEEMAIKLCGLLQLREYKAGTRLFRTGDNGDAMYLIESGRVRISVPDADGHDVTLSELHEGDFFGEMAMIDGHERSASATVLDNSRLAVLTRSAFIKFITKDEQVMLAMLMAMAARLRRTDNLLRHRVSRNVNVEAAAHTTSADRAADLIAKFGGSWSFIAVFMVLLLIWTAVNIWFLRSAAFDPYPFVFLNLVLAVITSLQAPIIMMSQNRQSRKDRLRSDLDYDVNLKNELLLTEIRTMLVRQSRQPRENEETFER